MKALAQFRLEEYLATREFGDTLMFCASDVESRKVSDLLSLRLEGVTPGVDVEKVYLDLSLKYTTPEGSLALRQSLAEMVSPLKSSQFHCFAGAEEAIYVAARALLNSTDHAIAISPCYQSLKSVAQSICDVSMVSLKNWGGRWNFDLEDFEKVCRPNTKMLFINFPHNPTGFIPARQDFLDLVDWAKRKNLILFSDEVYHGLAVKDEYTLPYASTVYERAISLGVTSKSFGLAGLRVGWVSSQDSEILKKMAEYKHYLSICNSAPSEFLAKIAVDHRRKIWTENNLLLRDNRKLMRDYFKSSGSPFEWIEPQGGCVAYPKYLGKEPILDLADALLKETGVVVLPDWVFEERNQHFRVSFGRKNMPLALEKFSKFFKERSLK